MWGTSDGGEGAVVMRVHLMIRRTEVEKELKFFVPAGVDVYIARNEL